MLVAPLALTLPMLPSWPAWLTTAVLPTTATSLLALGTGGALSGNWLMHIAAEMLGATTALVALGVIHMGEPAPGTSEVYRMNRPRFTRT